MVSGVVWSGWNHGGVSATGGPGGMGCPAGVVVGVASQSTSLTGAPFGPSPSVARAGKRWRR